MNIDSHLVFCIIGGIVVFVIVLRDAIGRGDEPTPPDLDRLTDEKRLAVLRERQEAARDRMKALGIKSLFDGRPTWQRINPMGRDEIPLHQQDARVYSMKKRRA